MGRARNGELQICRFQKYRRYHAPLLVVTWRFHFCEGPSQKCQQPITTLHSVMYAISLVPGFFFKNVDLLVKVLGRWPVGMDYFRRLRGLFNSTFCAYFFANFLKKYLLGVGFCSCIFCFILYLVRTKLVLSLFCCIFCCKNEVLTEWGGNNIFGVLF